MLESSDGLAVEDAVTVIGMVGTDFHDMHGLVVSIDEKDHPGGTIRVNFSEQYYEIFAYTGNGYSPEASMRFKPEDLKKEYQLNWEDQAYRDWPPSQDNAHWAHNERKELFVPGETMCQCRDCNEKAVIRGYMNIWGNFFSVDFCLKHKEKYNGHGSESLPFD